MGAAGPACVHRAGRLRALVVLRPARWPGGPADMAARVEAFGLDRVFGRRRGPRPRDPGAPAGGPALRDRRAATACVDLGLRHHGAERHLLGGERPARPGPAAEGVPRPVRRDQRADRRRRRSRTHATGRAGDRIRVPVTVSSWDGHGGCRRPRRLGDRGRRRIEPDRRAGSTSTAGRPGRPGSSASSRRSCPRSTAASRATVHLDASGRRGTSAGPSPTCRSRSCPALADGDRRRSRTGCGVTITDHLDRAALDRVRAGAQLLVLATDPAAIDAGPRAPGRRCGSTAGRPPTPPSRRPGRCGRATGSPPSRGPTRDALRASPRAAASTCRSSGCCPIS